MAPTNKRTALACAGLGQRHQSQRFGADEQHVSRWGELPGTVGRESMTAPNKRIASVCAGLAVGAVLVAATAQAQSVSFSAARSFEAGHLPVFVAVGDFN